MATLAGSFAAQAGVIVNPAPAGATGGLDDTHSAPPYADASSLTAGDFELAATPLTSVAAPAGPGVRAHVSNLSRPAADGIPGQLSIAGGLPSLSAILADLHRQRITVLRL
jgi:hypothetical protein